jgi:hypothetical protein
MFAFLRGEFVHLIDYNVQSNFLNHIFLPDKTNNLPYDTKYTTQRGLMEKTSTLIYEKKNLSSYTIRCSHDALIRMMTSTTIHSISAYAIVAIKDTLMLGQILEKILSEMKDDLNTKAYLKEILTGNAS